MTSRVFCAAPGAVEQLWKVGLTSGIGVERILSGMPLFLEFVRIL